MCICDKSLLLTIFLWHFFFPGILLYGPPGCAKTSLACALASALNVTFLSVSAADIYSPYVGDAEKSIVELFHRARLGAPAILFIDEIGKSKLYVRLLSWKYFWQHFVNIAYEVVNNICMHFFRGMDGIVLRA